MRMQADSLAHINSLYNTAFWAFVKSGSLVDEANRALQGTDAKEKNEVLFKRFGINYNEVSSQFRKGSVLVRKPPPGDIQHSEGEAFQRIQLVDEERSGKARKAKRIKPFEGLTGEVVTLHEDIIGDGFWDDRPWLLA